MRRLSPLTRGILSCVAIIILCSSGAAQGRQNAKGNGGRLSPASLDVDTCGCPTVFGQPTCEKRTSWTLEKTTDTGDITDPQGAPFGFDVTVAEGPTTKILSGTGTLVITNSGDQTTFLSSIVVLLEKSHTGAGRGDAPGPSGRVGIRCGVTGSGNRTPRVTDLVADAIRLCHEARSRGEQVASDLCQDQSHGLSADSPARENANAEPQVDAEFGAEVV